VKQRGALLLLGAVLYGCTDSAAPAAGMFRAQLTGARVGTLSGPANAEQIFTEEFPELQFAIRMHAQRGDTIQALVIRCQGDQPPASGDYALDPSGETCIGSYSRMASTVEGGTIPLETAAASSGILTIGPSQPGQTVGTFTFSGALIVDSDSVGTLEASGTFSADLL
jgi:hypothetical protein